MFVFEQLYDVSALSKQRHRRWKVRRFMITHGIIGIGLTSVRGIRTVVRGLPLVVRFSQINCSMLDMIPTLLREGGQHQHWMANLSTNADAAVSLSGHTLLVRVVPERQTHTHTQEETPIRPSPVCPPDKFRLNALLAFSLPPHAPRLPSPPSLVAARDALLPVCSSDISPYAPTLVPRRPGG